MVGFYQRTMGAYSSILERKSRSDISLRVGSREGGLGGCATGSEGSGFDEFRLVSSAISMSSSMVGLVESRG